MFMNVHFYLFLRRSLIQLIIFLLLETNKIQLVRFVRPMDVIRDCASATS